MVVDFECLSQCRACPRLRNWRARNAERFPDYHNAPVAPIGDEQAPLLVLGLAPGLHGANRTGVPFTGDGSGDLLFAALRESGLMQSDQPSALLRISNAVKCWPPENRPLRSELKLCRRFLRLELQSARVVLALGRVAHDAVLHGIGESLSAWPFSHGACHRLGVLELYDSYHCSRYNQNTGRINQSMLVEVLRQARSAAENASP